MKTRRKLKHCGCVLMQVILSIYGILFSIVLLEFMLLCCLQPCFFNSFILSLFLTKPCVHFPSLCHLEGRSYETTTVRPLKDNTFTESKGKTVIEWKWSSNTAGFTLMVLQLLIFLILRYGEIHMYLVAGGFQILNLDLCQPTVRWYYLSNVR